MKKFIYVVLFLSIYKTGFTLNSGPSAPEFSTFENSAMLATVNPLNGNLTYNIPVMTVPGPSADFEIPFLDNFPTWDLNKVK